MTLFRKINEYLTFKPNDKQDHNAVKHKFFTDIINLRNRNLLNVERLTEKLEALEEEERFKLFYFGRKWGSSNKEKASASCKTGQLILELYQSLDVPLTEKILDRFVKKGISKPNLYRLDHYHYLNWQKNPLLKSSIIKLEREIKGLLGIVQNKDETLAQYLNQDYKNLNIKLLFDKTPAYLPELIHQLFQSVKTDEQKKLLTKLIINEARNNPLLIQNMSEVNCELTIAFIKKNLLDFFQLSLPMQDRVCTLLEQKKDYETLNLLGNQILNKNSALQDFDQKALFKLLDQGDYRKTAAVKNNDGHETFKRLVDKVYERAITDPAQAYAHLQINNALLAINKYLKKDPNAFKTDFFKQLAAAIKRDGLSVEILQAHLNDSNCEKLFDKSCIYGGPKSSRAAVLMEELFKMSSLGAHLDIDNMINDGQLPPTEEEFAENIESDLRKTVQDLILQPQLSNQSRTQQKIGQALNYFQSFQQFTHRSASFKQRQAEAIYQNYLIEKGLNIANQQNQPVFDPQGHVLVTVSLGKEDYDRLSEIGGEEPGSKEYLELLLGAKITDQTFCNLDISAHKELRQKFIDSAKKNKLDNGTLNHFLNSADRGSVIPLQEEMSLHTTLSLRALEKFINDKGQHFILEGQQQLIQTINVLVMNKFSAALESSFQNDQINYDLLNKQLDKAREDLAPQCRKLLVEAISTEMSEEILGNFKLNWLPQLKDDFFTSTTATGLDYLRTDASNETVVRVSATEKTAHSKKQGHREQAIRVISRNHYEAEKKNVTAYSQNSIEARVPSIADINLEHSQAVADVALKLQYSKNRLTEQLGGYKGPLVYNLLTSVHSNAYDHSFFENENKQRTSASRILKGSHKYNNWQLASGEPESLVFVQNIPVNQHTNELNLHSLDKATAEATLMTELALLTTFKYHAAVFSPSLRENILNTHKYIHANYLKFLPKNDSGDHYFKESIFGKQAIAVMEDQKKFWKDSLAMEPADNYQDLAVQVLFKMTATNDYQKKQFGALVQALSIFVEPMSQAGCKSANERYQAVSGRVELLKSMNGINPEKRSELHNKILSTLENYVKGTATAKDLQAAMDIAYNKHNLYGASIFSEEDQGAGSKVQATSNKANPGKISEFNTNYAETNFLTRLKQKFAASMQAHKADLTKVFTELFNEVKSVANLNLNI
ncbi:MAG: hypothetical protein H0U57_06565 [Tatlockia sp.]|nr:hypothetical protein [Tatlockia sp.]